MPPVMVKRRLHGRLAGAALDGDRPARPDRGDVEGERLGRADVRLPEPAEQDAQHRVGVGGGADRGARVGAHPLLVDDDRGRQAVEHVDLGPRQRRHEALHEGAVGLVDQPLRLRGDRAEHQRALARAGDAGEHRQPALRDLDADVLEVVHARAVHADQIVAVGDVQRRRLRVRPRGRAHRASISELRGAGSPSGGVDAVLAWLKRSMLPAGSRKAQSRTPYGWSIGSCRTSAPTAHALEGRVAVVGGEHDAAQHALGQQFGHRLLVGAARCSGPRPAARARCAPPGCDGEPTVTQRMPSNPTSLRTSSPSTSR